MTWSAKVRDAVRKNIGCPWCEGQCLAQFANQIARLSDWRSHLHNRPEKGEQDAYIAWLFFGDMSARDLVARDHDDVIIDTSESDDVEVANTSLAASSNAVVPHRRRDIHVDRAPQKRDELQVTSAKLTKRVRLADGTVVEGEPIATSSDDNCDDMPLLSTEESRPTPKAKAKPKPRARNKPRAPYCINILDGPVCRKAAVCLTGVGSSRIQRIRRGDCDGRKGAKPAGPNGETLNAPLRDTCMTFLWQCYHHIGEAMPDRFNFAKLDGGGYVICTPSDANEFCPDWRQAGPCDLDCDDDELEEHESRVILAAARACSTSNALPDVKAAVGPGALRGPRRWLPPGKKIHLWMEYRMLRKNAGQPAAGYTTFLETWRAVFASGTLRMRKAHGMHAVCQVCEGYKKELRCYRGSPVAHEQTMNLYTEHLVTQWLDRQVADHMRDMSESCCRGLANGHFVASLAVSSSVLTICVDGMDQAKFRIPRQKVRSHAFERLYRPALHVQGVWAHGFGYRLAVSDADAKKDTVGNVETIARMLNDYFAHFKTLPLGLHIQQDNTSRECKNQKMLKFATSLVSMGVFRWVTLAYLVTGHTHCPLDGTFGEMTMRLTQEEFDDDAALVGLLDKFAKEVGIDEASRRNARAYKHDEAAKWDDWWDQLGLHFSNLTGPDAPHYFRVGLRSDVGIRGVPVPHDIAKEKEVAHATPNADWPALLPEDVVLTVKQRMSSLQVAQVIDLVPVGVRRRLMHSPQPFGVHARRAGNGEIMGKCADIAQQLLAERVINHTAAQYLMNWGRGVHSKEPRPRDYPFLRHRWEPDDLGLVRDPIRYDGGSGYVQRVRVGILGVSGRPLPQADEEDDDVPLILAPLII